MTARKPLVATDRAHIMLQLVPYLIGKGEVSITEAADEFGVTHDHMRAMVEKLTVIGLPGDGGYWQMSNDLFDIDWDLLEEREIIVITNSVALERAPKLSAREAAALLAGLQMARAIPAVGDSGIFTGLLAKLARGSSSTPADVIVVPAPVDEVRSTVAQALSQGVAVSFTYKAPNAESTTRTVDPVKVHVASGQWYLQGWCHLRESMRTFHLDRVSDLELTDIPISHGEEAVPAWFAPGTAGEVVVRLRFAEEAAPLLADYLDRAARETTDGITTATIRVADEFSLRRLAVRLGGVGEIIEPESVRRAAAEWAEAGLIQYR